MHLENILPSHFWDFKGQRAFKNKICHISGVLLADFVQNLRAYIRIWCQYESREIRSFQWVCLEILEICIKTIKKLYEHITRVVCTYIFRFETMMRWCDWKDGKVVLILWSSIVEQGKMVCKVTALRCYQCSSLRFLLATANWWPEQQATRVSC